MATQPNFYIVRPGTVPHWSPNGQVTHEPNIVPLIPADLLPDCIDLEGVARHLSFRQTAGMTNLGDVAQAGKQYGVKLILPRGEDGVNGDGVLPLGAGGTPESSLREGEAVGAGVDKADECVDGEKKVPSTKIEGSESSTENRPRQGLASSRHNSTSNNTISPSSPSPTHEGPPSTTVLPTKRASPKNKKYCTHWVRKGCCSFGNSCHFKHEMPQTTQGLRSVGLQGVPQWLIEYMHTERLPEISTPRAAGRKKNVSSSQGSLVGEGDDDGVDGVVGGTMSFEAARGIRPRVEDGDKGKSGVGLSTKWKTKKGLKREDLIDLS